MVIEAFPPVETADEDGLLALGGDLDVESLLLAYSKGIFPWPIQDVPLTWFSPPKRAILEFNKVHISRSLRRAMNSQMNHYEKKVDSSFKKVINLCAENRKEGTWITAEVKQAYIKLYEAGYAHSFEIWDDDKIIGGLYGVLCSGYFSAESMFFLKPNASKFALLFAIERLKAAGLSWMDIQMMTPHMERLGARVIDRKAFIKRIDKAKKSEVKLID